MAELSNAHDALIRAAFEDPKLVRAFLRDHLPNAIAAHLDLSRPQKVDGTFVDEALAGSQSDALFRVSTRSGRAAWCYLLVEHKSTPDTDLPLQLAGYMIRIWRRLRKEYGPALKGRLPAIVPLVLYNGERRWRVPDGLGAMIDAPPELVFLPGAAYILRNIGEIPTAALSQDPALKAVLIAMKREAVRYLEDVVNDLPMGSDLRRQVFTYISEVYQDVDRDDIMAELRRLGAHDMEAHMGTIAQTMHAEGKAVGLAEGLAAGEAKGKAEGLAVGKAETLLRLLERRFGHVPQAMRDRVAAADVDQLDTWFDAAIDAPSLSAVFDPNTPH
ncbi:Rpn family recombination-promoting nuclease/putative transposase [Ruegeria sp.]|uniref:Rpn family recombination-promoting nuclease/putative transposase n=1 Tax=Ruegeria sp. TaxID=1879320 RepID=UPI003B00ACD4